MLINKNNLVKKWNYGEYSSSNYGSHTRSSNYGSHTQGFSDNCGNDYYFSYETLVAFSSAKHGLVVRENVWSNTTGKHLNWINRDKDSRVTEKVFSELYKEL